MTVLFLLLVLPVATAVLAGIFAPVIRRFPGPTGPVLAFLYLGGAGFLLPAALGNQQASWSLPWVPELGMNLALRLTPFTAWFALLILFLGGCIHWFSCAYFARNRRLPALLILLGLFTFSMLGVVWADNLYLLFLCWEGTSLLSFLLVGFHHEQEKSRDNASQALLVTMLGGAALLAGFVLLHHQSGTSSLSDLLAQGVTAASPAAVILMIVGALTKSAQWPFHFWLPNAMVGPTPVSAYLHSATMVKAGVFLIGTLAPVLGSHPVWTPVLVAAGLLTVTSAVIRGLRANDLKTLLACTTLAALGYLTLLAGLATPAALLAFVIYLTAHALYKAPLFLAAGNLEKHFGTRDLSGLPGAARHLPVTGAVVLLSALSLTGIFPLPGFLGKEYLLKAAWAEAPALACAVALAASGVLAIGFRLILVLAGPGTPPSAQKAVPKGMTIATLIPALGTLTVVAAISLPQKFLSHAASSFGAPADASYHYWHGWTPALFLGLGAIAVGLVTGACLKEGREKSTTSLFDRGYRTVLDWLRRLSDRVARGLADGKLVTHLAIILAGIGLLSAISLDLHLWDRLPLTWSGASLVFAGLTPLLIIATLIAARSESTVPLLVSLGFVGFIIALIYLWFSAPDLALTQLMAETLILFLLAGALAKTENVEKSEPGRLRLILAALGGLLIAALILKSMTLEWDHPVSNFHLSQSKPAAHGANVVNVILVDFRAIDTLGEIIVLAIAAMGAGAALGAARKRAPLPDVEYSPLLSTGSRLLLYFLIPTIGWIFWRGHNAPGGGFIAALLTAAAVGMSLLTSRPRFTPSFMRRVSHRLLTGGLATATLAALIPIASGEPFLTGLWLHFGDLHLGTPLIFDLGVYLTVLGFCMNYFRHFHQRSL